MALAIGKPSNPYALTKAQVAQMKEFDALSEEEQGARLFREREEKSNRDFIAQSLEHETANTYPKQHLSDGRAIVGGALHPEALVNYGGLEMTVQQAVNLGVYKAEAIGHQTSDILEIEELV